MWPNLKFPADLFTFTREILNGKLHFLRSENYTKIVTVLKVDAHNLNVSACLCLLLRAFE